MSEHTAGSDRHNNGKIWLLVGRNVRGRVTDFLQRAQYFVVFESGNIERKWAAPERPCLVLSEETRKQVKGTALDQHLPL